MRNSTIRSDVQTTFHCTRGTSGLPRRAQDALPQPGAEIRPMRVAVAIRWPIGKVASQGPQGKRMGMCRNRETLKTMVSPSFSLVNRSKKGHYPQKSRDA